MTIRPVVAFVASVGLVAMTGCGSTHHPAAASAGAGASATTTIPAPATTVSAPAHNLDVSPDVRSQLLAAGAASHGLKPNDYKGLAPGVTYYAYDASTTTYWAGAGLVPSPSSYQAGVSSQDDGAYLLFERPAGGAWKVFDVGLAGIGGTGCPVAVPPAIVALWGWSPPGCRPTKIS